MTSKSAPKGGRAISLVVCGGTALAALDLMSRTTKDVDILGRRQGGKIKKMGVLPDWLLRAATKVARDYNLPSDWLNLGPESQLETGLPRGLISRLKKETFDKDLTIYFIDRKDQIFFKLYAALDNRGSYHESDLFFLKPTEEEIDAATRWVLTQDVSPEFKQILKTFLLEHGYGHVANGL